MRYQYDPESGRVLRSDGSTYSMTSDDRGPVVAQFMSDQLGAVKSSGPALYAAEAQARANMPAQKALPEDAPDESAPVFPWAPWIY